MKPRRAWCSWSREWDELYAMIDASRVVNRVVISRNCSMAGVETKGGIDSKITSRRDFYGPMGLGAIDYRHPLRVLNPPCATACRLSRPPRPVDRMLVGPYPPTHGSSYLFPDAMERRGRSRAVPKSAATRRSHHHQRQLYYSHFPPNPFSPSPSPVRSPQYVSLIPRISRGDLCSPSATSLARTTQPLPSPLRSN